MVQVRVDDVMQQPAASRQSRIDITERMQTMINSAHLNFLIGAGTSSPFFPALGNIEDRLTELSSSDASDDEQALVRASIQAYFFREIIARNLTILRPDTPATGKLRSYGSFIRTLNQILLRRNSTLLSKQANIFTTNVDMLFEVAMEGFNVDFSDGFSGKIRPKFDPGDFDTLRFRKSSRYEHRFEIPVFNLVKIHGSVSWRQVENKTGRTDIYFDHGLTLVQEIEEQLLIASDHLVDVNSSKADGTPVPRIRYVDELVDNARRHLESCQSDACNTSIEQFKTAYDKLGIINPDKRKFATTVMNETYYELIRRFANELEKENSVLFVHGFSFRDEHLRELVLRAARTNPTLQVIVFCYARSEISTFEALLGIADAKNGNIEIIGPEEPSPNQEEQKLDLDTLNALYFEPMVQLEPKSSNQRIDIDINFPTTEASHD
ncbi:SIR2 family protein [Actinomyces sp.]|uniref:SIR2 family protein n=1 Tax=Actinomyces sp. TaxID=29317 RepID=UPI00292CBE9E|nr:SIR2 family protein [Actinomyces sp.]